MSLKFDGIGLASVEERVVARSSAVNERGMMAIYFVVLKCVCAELLEAIALLVRISGPTSDW